jgi:NAD(P)-dependent dehydrogenase (short-subunit alcohol dehydrogenase family)
MAGAGKVAFVTGASSGIGGATAGAFVRRGYATVLVDRNETLGRQVEAELRKVGECVFIHCDVTDDEAVRGAVQATVDRYGGLDAAFNAAGIDGPQETVAESARENWDRVLAVNLTGVWSCMRHQIPRMLKTGGGSIVNCSSVLGITAAPTMSAYVASKHGVIGLTKAAAIEYVRQGIRVNCVCPGLIDTPLVRENFAPEWMDQVAEASPIGRFGKPIEVGEAVLWLCEDAASFVTGHAMVVDGGLTTQ